MSWQIFANYLMRVKDAQTLCPNDRKKKKNLVIQRIQFNSIITIVIIIIYYYYYETTINNNKYCYYIVMMKHPRLYSYYDQLSHSSIYYLLLLITMGFFGFRVECTRSPKYPMKMGIFGDRAKKNSPNRSPKNPNGIFW